MKRLSEGFLCETKLYNILFPVQNKSYLMRCENITKAVANVNVSQSEHKAFILENKKLLKFLSNFNSRHLRAKTLIYHQIRAATLLPAGIKNCCSKSIIPWEGLVKKNSGMWS